jgi:hypothetical protein
MRLQTFTKEQMASLIDNGFEIVVDQESAIITGDLTLEVFRRQGSPRMGAAPPNAPAFNRRSSWLPTSGLPPVPPRAQERAARTHRGEGHKRAPCVASGACLPHVIQLRASLNSYAPIIMRSPHPPF